MVAALARRGKPVSGSGVRSSIALSYGVPGRIGLEQTAAVDDEARARDEVRARQVGDRPGHVFGRADAAEEGLRGAALLLARLDGDRARRDAADADFRRERAGEDARQHRLGRLGGASARRTTGHGW